MTSMTWRIVAVALACAALAAGPARSAADEPIVVAMGYNADRQVDGRGYGEFLGAKAYFGRINAAGGIRGRKLVVESFDDHGDPRENAQGLARLVREKGAVAIFGCVGDAVCAASAAVARELHVPLIGALSGAPGLSRATEPQVFRVRADFRHEAAAVARQLSQLGCTHIAILSDASGAAAGPALAEALTASGLRAERVRVDPSQAGLEAAVRALGTGGFHAAVMNVAPGTALRFVDTGLSEREEWPAVLMVTANGDLDPLRAAFRGRVMGITQVVPNPEVLANPLARSLAEDADRYAGGLAVTPQGMEGYIAARLLVDALRRNGGKASADKIIEALDGIDDWSLEGFHLGFAPGRDNGSDWVEIGLRGRSGYFVN